MKYLLLLILSISSLTVNAQSNIEKLRSTENYDEAFDVLSKGFDYQKEEVKAVANLFLDDFDAFKQHFLSVIIFSEENSNEQDIRSIISELQRLSVEVESLKKKEQATLKKKD